MGSRKEALQMDNLFLLALENIKNAKQEDITAKVLEMFSKISIMNQEEVIATHQTYWFFRQHMKDVNKVDDDRLHRIHEALLNRMLAICCEPKDRSERARRVELLGQVAGGSVYYRILGRAIDGYKPPS